MKFNTNKLLIGSTGCFLLVFILFLGANYGFSENMPDSEIIKVSSSEEIYVYLEKVDKVAVQEKWEEFFDIIKTVVSLMDDRGISDEDIKNKINASFDIVYEQAIILARSGRYQKGVDLLDRLVDFKYVPEKSSFDRTIILVWQEKYEEAISAYEEIVASSMNPPEYLHRAMIGAYKQTEKFNKLLQVYERILTFSPHDQQMHTDAFELALKLSFTKTAEHHLEFLSKESEKDQSIALQLAGIRLKQGDLDGFLEIVSNASDPHNEHAKKLIKHYINQISKESLKKFFDEFIRDNPQKKIPEPEALLLMKYLSENKSESTKIRFFHEQLDKGIPFYETDLQLDIADLYYKVNRLENAEAAYLRVLEKDEHNKQAQLNLAHVYLKQNLPDKAMIQVNVVLDRTPKDYDALFLKGDILNHTKSYWEAIKVYGHILELYPESEAAFTLKSRALLDMGANSIILDKIDQQDSKGPKINSSIKNNAIGNSGMFHVQWSEPQKAISLLDAMIEEYEEIIDQPGTGENIIDHYWRARWDRILALRLQERMKEILAEYEDLIYLGKDVPFWIHETAVDAYLYEENPDKALEIYQDVLKNTSNSYNARLGIYSALVELGRYKQASQVLADLDRDTPKKIMERGILTENWRKADLATNKAWLLMYQDRSNEADLYLQHIVSKAPFNTNILSAQAQNYLWRGWPRKSLEHFKIIKTIDPDLVHMNIGYAQALNENHHKKQARALIHKLSQEHRANKHISRIQRQFDVEEMTTLSISAAYTEEFPGQDEWQVSMRLDQPINFDHTLFVETIRRETTNEAGNSIVHKAYVGDQWQPNNSWKFIGALSLDYNEGDDLGGLGTVAWTPDDYWTFDFGFESNVLSVPLRSRIEGVNADEYSFSSTLRSSEMFNTSIGLSLKDFDDSNKNFNYFWRTDTSLLRRAYWKLRIQTDFNYATYDLQNVSYFSPESIYSIYLIPYLEHVWYRQYEKAMVDRLYLGIGQQWQHGFGQENVGFIRYEQDYRISDRNNFVWGIRYNLNSYDGEDVNSLNIYTSLRMKF